MISLKQMLNHKIFIMVLSLFIVFILIFNTAYILIINLQYQQESKRQYEALTTMVSHLSTDSHQALIGYLEHYTHIHQVTITVLGLNDELIYTNDDFHIIGNYQIVRYEGQPVAKMGVDFESSQLSSDYGYGFVIINAVLFVLFLGVLISLRQYLNKWVVLIKKDIEQLNINEAHFYFTEFDHVHEKIALEQEEKQKQKHVYEAHIQSLAHDIKTPLTVIDIYTESILNHQMVVTENIISDIQDETKKIAEIVPKFIETDANELSYQQNIASFIFNYHQKYKEIFQIKQIEFDVTLEPLQVNISNQDLSRLMEHLTFNAFYYSNPNTRIHVSTSNQNRTLIIQDQGIGMSQETVHDILKGNYRSEVASMYHQQGTGIGYRIIMEIINRIHATIDIVSEINQGTKVTIHFK